jgi:putative phosphoesterase
MTRVGLISDTHGLLRSKARAALLGCNRIIHAGDIGTADILGALSEVAPVTAVRGNNDRGPWAERVPEEQFLRIDDITIYVLHDIARLALDPAMRAIQVVVSGHSHKPVVRDDGTVLYVNPGSAGPRRFRLPVTVAELTISGRSVSARIVELG